MSLVKGHALVAEGAAFDKEGDSAKRAKRVRYGTVRGRGRALCECGSVSPPLDSANQRKKWHREHKAEVSATRQEAQP